MKLDPYINFNFLKKNYKKLSNPEGKIALITGGTGRIGSVFTSIYLLNDFKVYVLSRDQKKFKNLAKNIPASYKKKLHWHEADLKKPDEIIKIIKKIQKKQSIHHLVNCAASHLRGKNIKYNTQNLIDEFLGIIGSNILITEEVIKKMRKQKFGNIINVGSIWGYSAPKFSTYLEMDIGPSLMTSVCKSGIHHFTKYLASREAKFNINVNGISPGWFPRKGKKSRNDYMESIRRDIPLNRIGKLEDLVSAINFLISAGNKYFTGQTIKIDGGHSIW